MPIDTEASPRRRTIKFRKAVGADFGSSLCSYQGRLYITDVYENTVAWRIGMQPGDRIDDINGIPIVMGPEREAHTVMQWLRDLSTITMDIAETPLMKTCTLVKEAKNSILGLIFTRNGVESSDPTSAAAKAMFRPGDAIVAVDGGSVLGFSEEKVMQYSSLRFHGTGAVVLMVFPAPLARELAFAVSVRATRPPRRFPLIKGFKEY